jgi:hypothetical protein
LDFAGHLAEKYPEELERQAIVDFLRNWDSERQVVDDATVIAAADQVPVYTGIDIVNLIFFASRCRCMTEKNIKKHLTRLSN